MKKERKVIANIIENKNINNKRLIMFFAEKYNDKKHKENNSKS